MGDVHCLLFWKLQLISVRLLKSAVGDPPGQLTEEVFDQGSVDRGSGTIAKGDNRSQQLADGEVLDRRGESIGRVECLGRYLTPDLGHGESVGIEDLVGPVANGLFKDGLVEDMIVTKVGVLTADARIVLEEIVDIKLVECEVGGVGLWVDNNCLFEHDFCQTCIEVEASAQTGNDICFCQVAAVWFPLDS